MLFNSYKSWQKRGAVRETDPALLWRAAGAMHRGALPRFGDWPTTQTKCPGVLDGQAIVGRAPQTSGPYALCHPFPPLAMPLVVCIINSPEKYLPSKMNSVLLTADFKSPCSAKNVFFNSEHLVLLWINEWAAQLRKSSHVGMSVEIATSLYFTGQIGLLFTKSLYM